MNNDERRKLHLHIANMSDKEVDAMLTLLENETVYEANSTYSTHDKAESGKQTELRERARPIVLARQKSYSARDRKAD